ncbi:MAG TPA: hypothetical protein ENK02_10810 [Planctomycetes bacterium]|nr:hypothetical protein [Planctomycetota bacterium]
MKSLQSLFLAVVALGLFSATSSAQKLRLSVTKTGNKATLTVSGALPGAPVLLFVGFKEGKTVLYKGSNTIEALSIGLATPFVPLPLGSADKKGRVSKSYPALPIKLPIKILGQALSPTPKIKFGLPPKVVLGWLLSKVVKVFG